jgi:hypothetical protein
MPDSSPEVPAPLIESRIYVLRGQKVMLDADLAALYQVETGALNRAVRRNADRFPEDFMFQLTSEETEAFEMPNWHFKRRYRPWRPPRSPLRVH